MIASDDTPFDTVPSTATRLAKELGIGLGPHCDANSACSSFALHAQLLSDLKEDRVPEFVLCVHTGAFTTRTRYSAASTDGYILGDGAAAEGLYAENVYTVSHQANRVMQHSIVGHLNLPLSRHLSNVQEQGNIAAAGCPSVLAQKLDTLRKGDQIVYAVLGAGLAWGGGYMEVL